MVYHGPKLFHSADQRRVDAMPLGVSGQLYDSCRRCDKSPARKRLICEGVPASKALVVRGSRACVLSYEIQDCFVLWPLLEMFSSKDTMTDACEVDVLLRLVQLSDCG